MRRSILAKVKQEDVKGSFLQRLSSLDFKFWSSWKGLLLLIAFPILALSVWGGLIHADTPSISWGELGDSFAPITSLFTALAFEAAVITLLQQRKELQEQHEASKLQKKELKVLQSQTEITTESNELARARLELDMALQWAQLSAIYTSLLETDRVEELAVVKKLMARIADKL